MYVSMMILLKEGKLINTLFVTKHLSFSYFDDRTADIHFHLYR